MSEDLSGEWFERFRLTLLHQEKERGSQRMSEHSWRGNLGRTGGFYQDADWYRANLRRKVHE